MKNFFLLFIPILFFSSARGDWTNSPSNPTSYHHQLNPASPYHDWGKSNGYSPDYSSGGNEVREKRVCKNSLSMFAENSILDIQITAQSKNKKKLWSFALFYCPNGKYDSQCKEVKSWDRKEEGFFKQYGQLPQGYIPGLLANFYPDGAGLGCAIGEIVPPGEDLKMVLVPKFENSNLSPTQTLEFHSSAFLMNKMELDKTYRVQFPYLVEGVEINVIILSRKTYESKYLNRW